MFFPEELHGLTRTITAQKGAYASPDKLVSASAYERVFQHENVLLVDSTGVIYEGRPDINPDHPRFNPYKAYFAQTTDARTLADAMEGTDAFAGVSVAGIVTQDMVRAMADYMALAAGVPEAELERLLQQQALGLSAAMALINLEDAAASPTQVSRCPSQVTLRPSL